MDAPDWFVVGSIIVVVCVVVFVNRLREPIERIQEHLHEIEQKLAQLREVPREVARLQEEIEGLYSAVQSVGEEETPEKTDTELAEELANSGERSLGDILGDALRHKLDDRKKRSLRWALDNIRRDLTTVISDVAEVKAALNKTV